MKVKVLDYYVYASAFYWGPLLYLYVQQVTGQNTYSLRKTAQHLALPLLVSLGQIPIHVWGIFPHFGAVFFYGFFAYVSIYIFACLKALQQHQASIRQSFSQVEELQLSWLKRLVGVFTVSLVIDFGLSFTLSIGLLNFTPMLGLVILLESATIFAIGYFALQQPVILFSAVKEASASKKKYDNSALDTVLAKSLSRQLVQMMEKDQPYKRNDLKLGDLADLMDLSSHHLSQVINEQMGCNFYEFINQYRIDYAAELLRRGGPTNITKLAFDAGFNNRVSFTNAFKKQIGSTPSAYIKEHSLKQAS